MVLLIVPLGISGCSRGTDSVDNGIIEVPPSVRGPVIAYKSNRTEFDIYDVALNFYYGSENSGYHGGAPDITDAPIITYLYFANENYFVPLIDYGYLFLYYKSGIDMKNMYGDIETDNRIHISKIIPSDGEDSLYKSYNVKVFGKDKNLSHRFLTMLWGGDWSVLCNVKSSYEYNGILVPELCSEFTIPSSMFTSNNGYIMFCMTSYFTDDYCDPLYGRIFKAGTMLENTHITIY